MKKNFLYIIGAALLLTGCNFLDKEPDLRAEINTQKKVQLLLASGYEMSNYGTIGEVMSDNVIDNNTDPTNQKVPMNTMFDDVFAWRPVDGYNQQDSPYSMWSAFYSNIAVANQALIAIDNILKKDSTLDLNAERAEALLIRAYNHFLLVNIFCQAYKNDDASRQDIGIHYMISAETTVRPTYERGTVTEVYQHIEEDLVAALPYVNDKYYSVPKYHFNARAAAAFAAKFYLFKRDYEKAIKYANQVLGTNPEDAKAMMWDAASAKLLGNPDKESYAWIDATSNSNLLICTTMSAQCRMFSPSYGRYTTNGDTFEYLIGTGGGPCWSGNFPGAVQWSYDAKYGSFFGKIIEHFEYTDKVAGIGYVHTMRRELTANECLLTRAEAKIMTGDLDGALSDMDIWCQSYKCESENMTTLNAAKVSSFASSGRQYPSLNPICPTLHTEEMGWGDKAVAAGSPQEDYLLCCLHLRRIETLFDGNRLFDLKRFGIEIKHEIGYPIQEDVLTWNDPRRAIQLPQEAILGGQLPNPGYPANSNGTSNSIVSSELRYPYTEYTLQKKVD